MVATSSSPVGMRSRLSTKSQTSGGGTKSPVLLYGGGGGGGGHVTPKDSLDAILDDDKATYYSYFFPFFDIRTRRSMQSVARC